MMDEIKDKAKNVFINHCLIEIHTPMDKVGLDYIVQIYSHDIRCLRKDSSVMIKSLFIENPKEYNKSQLFEKMFEDILEQSIKNSANYLTMTRSFWKRLKFLFLKK